MPSSPDWSEFLKRPPDFVVTVDDAIAEGILIPTDITVDDASFPLGCVLISDGVETVARRYGNKLGWTVFAVVEALIARHSHQDWGELSLEDVQVNAQALVTGGRLMSVYSLADGETIWIFTECDRSATTVLLPSEY